MGIKTDNVRQAVPFLAVSSMERSVLFYVDDLGFRMTNEWVVGALTRWCRLELGNAAIMLQEFPREGNDSWQPKSGWGSGVVGEGVTICIMCEDALQIYREIVSRGVTPRRPFVGNGLWVMSVVDPDGYKIDFESPTDAAEDTVLADDAT